MKRSRRPLAPRLERALLAVSLTGLAVLLGACDDDSPSAPASSEASGSLNASASTSGSTPEASASLVAPATADPSAAVGTISPDMPEALKATPLDATIVMSEALIADGWAEVSLSFTTPASSDEVVAFYDAQLAPAGYSPTDSPATQAAGVRVRIYQRPDGSDFLSLSVLDDGAQRRVTIGGTMRADAADPAQTSESAN